MADPRNTADPDPRPLPPPPLDDDACCGQGCDPCVFDLHAQALERHRAALQAWLRRHPEAPRD